jgi:hypothetical protein
LELLQLFRNANTDPLASFILPSPHHKTKETQDLIEVEPGRQIKSKKGKGLKNKTSNNEPTSWIAQEILAKNVAFSKWIGVLMT